MFRFFLVLLLFSISLNAEILPEEGSFESEISIDNINNEQTANELLPDDSVILQSLPVEPKTSDLLQAKMKILYLKLKKLNAKLRKLRSRGKTDAVLLRKTRKLKKQLQNNKNYLIRILELEAGIEEPIKIMVSSSTLAVNS